MDITDKRFKVIVRPNSRESKVVGFDAEKKAYKLNIRARPDDNKANIEAMKFLSRLLKRKTIIVSGHKSRNKVMEVLD